MYLANKPPDSFLALPQLQDFAFLRGPTDAREHTMQNNAESTIDPRYPIEECGHAFPILCNFPQNAGGDDGQA